MATCGIYEALWLARLHCSSARALYLHAPFCVRKCAYCDFPSWATACDDPLLTAYRKSLSGLMAEAASLGLLDGCETAYVGGGTPTLMGGGLVKLVRDLCVSAPDLGELTCEANPDSLGDELLERLAEAGCTRLSIGVQSLDDGELSALGRIHTAERALERLKAAVTTGLDVSADLMCAIPRQTDESWHTSLEGVVEAGAGHVSIYPLQIEEGTPLGKRYADVDPAFNDPEVQEHRMRMAAELLARAGFDRYEVASYARGHAICRHNQAYWTAQPYLGLGSGASSMLTREGYERLRGGCPQLPPLGSEVQRVRLTCTDGRRELAGACGLSELHFDLELLNEGQAAAEDLMLGMRMVCGADPGLVAHARAVLGEDRMDEALAWCEERGLVVRDGLRWVPTDQGWLLGNELYGCLWDLAPSAVRSIAV